MATSLSSIEFFMDSYLSSEPWKSDPQIIPVPWRKELAQAPERALKIAYIVDDGVVLPQPPIQRAVREMVAKLNQSSAALDRGFAASGSSPSQSAVRREHALLLADALNRLPADYREVIVLRHIEALSFAEAGERMERTENSVQKLWVRALARLRQELGDIT